MGKRDEEDRAFGEDDFDDEDRSEAGEALAEMMVRAADGVMGQGVFQVLGTDGVARPVRIITVPEDFGDDDEPLHLKGVKGGE